MRKWYAIGLLSGLTLLACGEEEKGPNVSEKVSWQYSCTGNKDCTTGSDPHKQTTAIQASCSAGASGWKVRLEDPGLEEKKGDQNPRSHSVLEITAGVVAQERCTVVLTEYDTSSTTQYKKLTDTCMGNDNAGSCVFEGKAGNGFDFDGTLFCDGMKYGNTREFKLHAAGRDEDAPIVIQIKKCD
jgi:hypothetical protein